MLRLLGAIVAAFVVLTVPAYAGFVVKDFSCRTSAFGVDVDVSGLGNQNVCIVGEADPINLQCACAGGGGNCPSDTKKQSIPITVAFGRAVEPKNGRVISSFDLGFSPGDGLCAPLNCPSGQTEKLVSWFIPAGGAEFTLCTTNVPAGQTCSCDGARILDQTTCGPTGDIVFAGKRGSCTRLFD